jgi:hypothetical protein
MSQPVTITCSASAAIGRGRFVRLNSYSSGIPVATQATDGTTATGHLLVGIAATAATAAGDLIDVVVQGRVDYAIASAAIAPGTVIGVTADAEIKAAASGDQAVGIMLGGRSSTGASANDAVCSILLAGIRYPVA